MTLRSLILCAWGLALAAPAAHAQNPAAPPAAEGPGRAALDRRRALLFKDITLTADQQAKIDSIHARYRAERPAFTPGTPPDSATRSTMRERMRAQMDDIRSVLAPDQQELWDRNMAALRERRPGGP
jgi:Spy/CpxP family protein refolding chaperone